MFTPLTDENYEAAFASTDAGICIFFKKLCPHCLNMEKVLNKVSQRVPGLTLLSMDIEENPTASAACGAERAPTLVVLKGGKIVSVKAGLMNPKESTEFFQKA